MQKSFLAVVIFVNCYFPPTNPTLFFCSYSFCLILSIPVAILFCSSILLMQPHPSKTCNTPERGTSSTGYLRSSRGKPQQNRHRTKQLLYLLDTKNKYSVPVNILFVFDFFVLANSLSINFQNQQSCLLCHTRLLNFRLLKEQEIYFLCFVNLFLFLCSELNFITPLFVENFCIKLCPCSFRMFHYHKQQYDFFVTNEDNIFYFVLGERVSAESNNGFLPLLLC